MQNCVKLDEQYAVDILFTYTRFASLSPGVYLFDRYM